MSAPSPFPPPTAGPPPLHPPGWYVDPWDPALVRWWDGTRWTEHTGSARTVSRAEPDRPTLPIGAAVAGVVLTITALVASRIVLDALGHYRFPIVVYVAISATLGYLPMVFFFWWVVKRVAHGSFRRDLGFEFRWADAGWGPLVWIGAVAAELAAAIVVTALDVPLKGNTESIDELSVERGVLIALLITAVVVAPFVEEIMFRGVILRGLSSRLAPSAAVVVQGMLFGAAHIDPARGAGNIGLVILLSAVGVAFGLAARTLGRIGPTIIAHAIFNGVVMLIALNT